MPNETPDPASDSSHGHDPDHDRDPRPDGASADDASAEPSGDAAASPLMDGADGADTAAGNAAESAAEPAAPDASRGSSADAANAAAPPPGTGEESYPLEVPGEETPVGPDVPSDLPPCPSCGSERRVAGPICLRCGWDDSQNRYHLVTDAPEPEVAGAAANVAASASVGGAAVGAAATAATAAPPTTAGDDSPGAAVERTKVEDEEIERHERPLVRRLPGDPYTPWAIAVAVTLLLVIAGLSGAGVLYPDPAVAAGVVDGAGAGAADAAVAEGTVSFGVRIRWVVRTLLVQTMWWGAIAGAGLVFAWFSDRRIGDAIGYAGRTLAVVSVARLAALLGIPSVLAAFLVEGLLHLIIAVAVAVGLLHLRGREAIAIVLGGSLALGGLLLIANVLAWAA
ncbi:MAG: hypothetical protein AB8G96_08560 [Phycisphaerales bacterium]